MRTPRIAVVGGGLIGLAVAWRLAEARPGAAIVVLEKEDGLARHQSGRNSGVLHSGLYYKPGSEKARLCRAGKAAMERFCDERGVRRVTCGKVVVATDEAELGRLEALFERGRANGVDCERVGPERLRELGRKRRGLEGSIRRDADRGQPRAQLALARVRRAEAQEEAEVAQEAQALGPFLVVGREREVR